MSRMPRSFVYRLTTISWIVVIASLAGCFSARGLIELEAPPYPLSYEDDSTARYGNPDDTVFIEVRRTEVPRPLENLAIRYAALFPGGEIIRPGDTEEYSTVEGRKAYKVIFQPTYVRYRKRIDPEKKDEPPPSGWTRSTLEDPETGKPSDVLYGPTVRRYRVLYLVEGDSYVYYVFMRADGETIDSAKTKFEEFVRRIKYK